MDCSSFVLVYSMELLPCSYDVQLISVRVPGTAIIIILDSLSIVVLYNLDPKSEMKEATQRNAQHIGRIMSSNDVSHAIYIYI